MSMDRRPAGRSRHVAWVAAAALLVALLGASFVMGARARRAAEADAEARAQRAVVSALSTAELTPDIVAEDVPDRAYPGLLARMQAAILSDPSMSRVRIWRPDGDLIFSTSQTDDVDDFIAVGHAEIGSAAQGDVTSVVVPASDAPPAGLEGSDETLLVTYVPLRFPNEAGPSAVVEVDQVYDAIDDEANGVWQPVQIGLAVALAGLGVLFGFSRRAGRRRSRWVERAPRESRDARKLRDAENRAVAAERAVQQLEEQLAEAEGRLAELAKADVAPEVRERIERLELRLRAEEAEREQLAGEAKRLRSALSEREAELALAKEGSASTEAEKARSIEAVLRAEQQAADAERRAVAAGALAADAEAKANASDMRVVELEAALRDADRRLTAAVAAAESAAQHTRREEEARAGTELRTAQLEANELRMKVEELEAALRDAEARRAENERATVELERVREAAAVELERVRAASALELEEERERADRASAELEETRLALQRTKVEAEAGGEEIERMRGELGRARAELGASRDELERARAEGAEAAATELLAARAQAASLSEELEASRAELQGATAEAARLRAELERAELDRAAIGPVEAERVVAESAPALEELQARLAGVEAQRRQELESFQRAQESLANTQLELVEANRRLRAAEDRARELEGAAARPTPSPQEAAFPRYEPVPAHDLAPTYEPGHAEVDVEPVPAPVAEDLEDEDLEGEPLGEEALSLRERLARAAAARHRTAQPPE
jgi:hypothetical protein